ncbi:MAG: hypothetical protein KGI56_05805 [Acidobacteriota bacterium]|nr:hypothetical protein [Acidobacteriota bacterium]
MGTLNRREILGRMTALVAGPLLLSRKALNLALQAGRSAPPEAPPGAEPPRRPTLAPPSHSVPRRG